MPCQLVLRGAECTHTRMHTHPVGATQAHAPGLLSPLLPDLLQLAEVFTLAQQPAEWLHMLLAEAAACESAAGRGANWEWGHSDPLPWLVLGVASEFQRGLTQAWILWKHPASTTPTSLHSRSHQHSPSGEVVLKVWSPTTPTSIPWELGERHVLGTQPKCAELKAQGTRLSRLILIQGELQLLAVTLMDRHEGGVEETKGDVCSCRGLLMLESKVIVSVFERPTPRLHNKVNEQLTASQQLKKKKS